ncbi:MULTISPECIES: hypothetical protein [Clostridium]|uniref:Uncharacterized protein n=2 Tax=Clostridium TaxID=1485 RepID=A0AAU8YU16_CLOBO|nr:hypothetical protein [Clostridium sporogenes]AVP60495.1 hypothetical protein C7M79_07180 [Clostridium botulinum]AVP63898.1 hypothetical protein C3B64_06385 [Clostridium botulinum]EHN13371.1 hypothetical protein IYC_19920 [Clostridium sporogenes PA 3679]MBA4510058.1 hypothetical protein [Clostridium sporogenes]MBW5457003.1 hypothetical protein [Clostridium sporogenes]
MGIFLSNVITEKLNNLHKHPIVHKNVDRKKKKKYCKTFKRGSNGFCKHCMGYKVDLVSCANECEVGGLGDYI